jgi:lactoylglutathione lyase
MLKLGYTLFYVDDVEKSISFYKNAFGLEAGFVDKENKQYGELITGSTKLGFVQHQTAASHGFQYEYASLDKYPFAIEIGFISEDVQASFDRAVAAGAVAVSKPQQKPWGQTVSYVRDLNGFLVEICSAMN